MIKVTDGSKDLEESSSREPRVIGGDNISTATGTVEGDTNSTITRKQTAAPGDENGKAGKKVGRPKRKRPTNRCICTTIDSSVSI